MKINLLRCLCFRNRRRRSLPILIAILSCLSTVVFARNEPRKTQSAAQRTSAGVRSAGVFSRTVSARGGNESATHTRKQIHGIRCRLSARGTESFPRVDLLDAMFDDSVISSNVLRIQQRARDIENELARYHFLSDWVLPSYRQSNLRVSGQFVPGGLIDAETDAAGGVLVSPVFDLLEIANKLGRLEELRQQVVARQVMNSGQQRARTSLLILIELHRGNTDAAAVLMDEFVEQVTKFVPKSIHQQWPEMLVAYADVKHFPKSRVATDLIEFLHAQREQNGSPRNADALHVHTASLMGQRLAQQQRPGTPINRPTFSHWLPVERHRQQTRGAGFSGATWSWGAANGSHVTGHEDDYLFFDSPLRGDFEVDADIGSTGRTQVLSAGFLCGQTWRGDAIFEGNVRDGVKSRPLETPLAKREQWTHYRAIFRGEECEIFLNGRHIKTIPRRANSAPWFAMRSWSRTHATFRDVRITGHPEIPASIDLLNPELSGWWTYFGSTLGYPSANWNCTRFPEGDQIVGSRKTELAGTSCERLLRYLRPLPEQSSVEFEYYYHPGRANAFPAIDRLAFAVTQEKVLVHQVTDGAYDQSAASPALKEYHAFVKRSSSDTRPIGEETESGHLPLLAHAWNQIELKLNGNHVTLTLNGQQVSEHELKPGNSRHFGLFHFADIDELRVRRVVMTGDWATELPAVSEQIFADRRSDLCDATMPSEIFRHDFAISGADSNLIDLAPGKTGRFVVGAAGVEHLADSSGAWAQSHLAPSFRLDGDFDVRVKFDSLTVSDHEHNGCGIAVTFAGGYQIELNRRRARKNLQRVTASWGEPAGNGEFRRSYSNLSTEALAGTLRIARRADEISVMFAENDSDQFRVIGARTFSDIGQQSAELQAKVVANFGGNTRVTWNSLQLAADELWHLPDPRQQRPIALFVMDSSGKNVRQITQPQPETSQGSPDGKQIAFDTWTGNADSTFMYMINADGTGMKNIGLGSMPTFSASKNRLCCTSLLTGTVTFDNDGKDRKILTDEGWGAQWSPSGKWIAYESRHRVNGRLFKNITLLDVQSGEKRVVLKGEQAERYSWIYYNMEWSPDSREICFKGKISGGQEVCIVDIDTGSVRTITDIDMTPDFSWHPTQDLILMSGLLKTLGGATADANDSTKGHRLYLYNLKTEEFRLLPGQPMNQNNTGMAWSPDGQQIAFVGRPFSGPQRWTDQKFTLPKQKETTP